ncbi:MAG: hypothetical protein E7270_09370 [Lachnospiraceae bacterium]|nr:hypothetical protein [Lachnospiraceae bacterium]
MNNMNNKSKYFDVVPNKDDIDLKIKWNEKSFVDTNNDTGYIVQHMIIKSNISAVKNDDYWECWHIENGSLENQTNKFDDNWSPIPSCFILMCEDEINASPDGLVNYSAEIYWIPNNSTEYAVVKNWKPVKSSPAGELPMTYQFDYDVDKYFVCNRFYEWNYKEELLKMKEGE